MAQHSLQQHRSHKTLVFYCSQGQIGRFFLVFRFSSVYRRAFLCEKVRKGQCEINVRLVRTCFRFKFILRQLSHTLIFDSVSYHLCVF